MVLRTIFLAAALLFCAVRAPAQASSPEAAERVLVIGTKDAPPFAMRDDNGAWTGLSIELWKHIAEQLHLNYRFQETTLEGLVNGIASGKLDAAISALTVTREREEAVDFTQPYYDSGLGIAVERHPFFNWWRLLRSLISPGFFVALLGLLGITVLIGLIVWVLERRVNEVFGHDPKTGISQSVWWSASTMAQASTEHQPTTIPGRIIALLWMGLSVITIAVFTAGVTSQLTTRQLQGTVHNFNDLKSVRVGTVTDTAALTFLSDRKVGYTTYQTVRDGLEALKAGQIDAFVYDRPILAWLSKNEFTSIEVLDPVFDKQNYAIAVPNGSALRSKINMVLVPATQTIWWDELNAKYFGASESSTPSG